MWKSGKVEQAGNVTVRPGAEPDLAAIAAIAAATGQDEDWDEGYPAYLRHLIAHGTLLVGSGTVASPDSARRCR